MNYSPHQILRMVELPSASIFAHLFDYYLYLRFNTRYGDSVNQLLPAFPALILILLLIPPV
jgi:hypothetical protein